MLRKIKNLPSLHLLGIRSRQVSGQVRQNSSLRRQGELDPLQGYPNARLTILQRIHADEGECRGRRRRGQGCENSSRRRTC